ncbi:MAG: ATP-dependent Clp protease ATP-binding subunit [Myxococcales bacterium]|nr:MAG: ATP-dependent Clp protease ATP-binding subunit [Myxococcales bacterium]
MFIQEPSESESIQILRGVEAVYSKHHGVSFDDDAVALAVTLSSRYIHDRFLPDKAIGALDLAAARIKRAGKNRVTDHDIAQVISEHSRVPVERLLKTDADSLLQLEDKLLERIVGQDEVVAKVAASLRKSAAGFLGNGPLGVFLALGPTGVGKTELAKAISELLFPGIEIARFDMAEFSEAHAVARLLGAPPGYIGHDEGGQLTEAVRNRPYQLILLDEIDKAHREVLLSLLPLLDEGRLSDARGRTVDFTHTIIMMTSNFGAKAFIKHNSIGFEDDVLAKNDSRKSALDAARGSLAPELWNRIDEPLVFLPLTKSEVVKIAKKRLASLQEKLFDQNGIVLKYKDNVVDVLMDQGGFDSELGARPLNRAVSRLIEAPLADALLSKKLSAGSSVCLKIKDGDIAIEAQ